MHERYSSKVPKVIVLGNPDWRPSLLGLVANTCAEEFDRPAFFWGRDGESVIKGSCRSEGKTNVVELMRASLPETFIQFGGHKHSGGFAVSNEQVHFLEERLNDAVEIISLANKKVRSEIEERLAEDFIEITDDLDEDYIDRELTIDEVNQSLSNELNKLAPFGVGNPKPIFLFRNIRPFSVRKFGKGNDHIEMVFKKTSGEKVPAIAFFGVKEKWADKVSEKTNIDLIASVEKSMFRGRSEIRLRVTEVTPL